MTLKQFVVAGVFAVTAAPALAEITIVDAYARSASPMAMSGAAFMEVHNSGAEDDRLIGVTSDAAARTELHTHIDMGDGVMQMSQVEDGLVIPADGAHMLKRGGDHVMLMGLSGPWKDGETVSVTLEFEQAGQVVVEIPIDQRRAPKADDGS